MALPFFFLSSASFLTSATMAKKLTQEEFIQRAKAKHGDKYDYSKVEYKGYYSEVTIICPKHGETSQKALLHLSSSYGCPLCGHESKRKLIFGVGILDVVGYGSKAYFLWHSILSRCYNDKQRWNNKSYQNATVCKEWHKFSNFKRWFESPKSGYREGYQIDKDILIKGNKVYSPETCCFVPIEINSMLAINKRSNKLPRGVRKANSKYMVRISTSGSKSTYIGVYDTPEEAFNVYKQAKEAHIQEVATKYFNEGKITEKVYNALMKYEVEITD